MSGALTTGRTRPLNDRQQLVGRDVERHRDLSHPTARDQSRPPPIKDRGPGNAQPLAQSDGAASPQDQRLDGDGHVTNRRLFRRTLSSPFVGYLDTSNPKYRHLGGVNNLKAIGRRIKDLRHKAGEGQEDLAAVLGVTRSTIAGIETGRDQGGLTTMIAIADHYKVPFDWLLGRRVPPGGPAVGQFVDSPDEVAWVAFWRGLNPTQRSAVLTTLRIPFPNSAA